MRPAPPPKLRPPSAALQALLLVAAAALSGATILRGYGPHDEGLMLAWAQRVADGQWPYRDFWSNYAPGQTLVLAAATKLFGPSLLVWRVLRVAVDAFTALAAFRLVRRDAGDWWGLAAWRVRCEPPRARGRRTAGRRRGGAVGLHRSCAATARTTRV